MPDQATLDQSVLGAFARSSLRPENGRVLVACSGGPDSMALLDVLAGLRATLALELSVVTVDHQLRPAARGECESVLARASSLGISARMIAVEIARPSMASARAVRYEALLAEAIRVNAGAIAVAHTASDQAETLLDRLIRGAGTGGLSAMAWRRAIAPGVELIRPLLGVSRDEIEAHVASHNLSIVRDPTNQDLHYRRSRLRHEVMPLLRRERPDLDASLSELCDRLRADDDALVFAAEEARARLFRNGSFDVSGLFALPWALFSRVIAEVYAAPLGEVHLRAIHRLCASSAGSQSLDLPAGVAMREYGRLTFSRARQADPGDVEVAVEAPGEYEILGARVAISQAVRDAHPWLILRNARCGDRVRLGEKHRKLQDLFTDAKVPRMLRRRLPLLVRRLMDQEEVVWIGRSIFEGTQECSLTQAPTVQ